MSDERLDRIELSLRQLASGQEALRADFNQRFEKMDQRLDNVDQRLDSVDQRLDSVDQQLDKIDQRLDKVDQRLDKVDQRLDKVDHRLDKVDHRLDGVDKRLDKVDHRLAMGDDRFDAVSEKLDGQGQHMRLIHQDALTRLAAMREFDGPSRAEFQQGLADLEERIGRRLDPLVLAVRHHSEAIRQNTAEIEALKRSRQ